MAMLERRSVVAILKSNRPSSLAFATFMVELRKRAGRRAVFWVQTPVVAAQVPEENQNSSKGVVYCRITTPSYFIII